MLASGTAAADYAALESLSRISWEANLDPLLDDLAASLPMLVMRSADDPLADPEREPSAERPGVGSVLLSGPGTSQWWMYPRRLPTRWSHSRATVILNTVRDAVTGSYRTWPRHLSQTGLLAAGSGVWAALLRTMPDARVRPPSAQAKSTKWGQLDGERPHPGVGTGAAHGPGARLASECGASPRRGRAVGGWRRTQRTGHGGRRHGPDAGGGPCHGGGTAHASASRRGTTGEPHTDTTARGRDLAYSGPSGARCDRTRRRLRFAGRGDALRRPRPGQPWPRLVPHYRRSAARHTDDRHRPPVLRRRRDAARTRARARRDPPHPSPPRGAPPGRAPNLGRAAPTAALAVPASPTCRKGIGRCGAKPPGQSGRVEVWRWTSRRDPLQPLRRATSPHGSWRATSSG